MGPLKDELQREAPWLTTDPGFRIISFSYDPAIFGDSMVVLRSDALCLRIIRERGRIFAEVAPLADPQNWWDLGMILEVLHRPPPGHHLQSVAGALRTNLPAVIEALGPNLSVTTDGIARRFREKERATLALVQRGKPNLRRPLRSFTRSQTGRLVAFILTALLVLAIVWMILSH